MIEVNFLDPIFNWSAVAAIGTVLSAVVALGIAFLSFRKAHEQEQQFHIREAVEKLVVPIKKELDSFSLYKWDLWYAHNRWHLLKDKKDDMPLQYYALKNANANLVDQIESFDNDFYSFTNLENNTGVRQVLLKTTAETFREFVEGRVVVTGNAGRLPDSDDQIINSHWRGYAGDGVYNSVVVTLYSLVLWKASLSDFLDDRKVDKKTLKFELGDLTFAPEFDVDLANEVLLAIETKISENTEVETIEEYRRKWAELYEKGNALVKDIESWYGSL
jgi:hypothetical protein